MGLLILYFIKMGKLIISEGEIVYYSFPRKFFIAKKNPTGYYAITYYVTTTYKILFNYLMGFYCIDKTYKKLEALAQALILFLKLTH